jgi:UDP-2,4-diacetamido-2,4,6-trideoxy-beta-L-altropyranose hydrolase
MRIAIRVDASARIGLGHLLRCLALAQAMRLLDVHVCFVTRELGLDSVSRLQAGGFAVHLLPAPEAAVGPNGPEASPHADWLEVPASQDADETAAALHSTAPWHWVVVDHYALDASWHRAVAAATGASIAVIDDLADRPLAAALLVDHNLAEPDHRQKYAERLAPDTDVLGGPRFALLGPAYAQAARCAPGAEVRRIGIFLGGTDPAKLSAVALRACREVAGFRGAIELVSTRANPRHAELRTLAASWPDTTLSLDLPDLAAFFARHDLQIGAGGGATWERCCIGAPTLALVAAANQLAVVPQLERLGAVAALPAGIAPTVETVGRTLRALIDDGSRRTALAARARKLVDGHGAMRVALRLAARTLHVRPATMADSECMHRWRNHPATRAVSRTALPIDYTEHQRWLARTLADSRRLLLIGEIGPRSVGVIRFDRHDGDIAEVSLYLDPELHGLSLGAAMLRAGERAAAAWWAQGGCGALTFEATVLDGNAGSRRLFQAAGYAFDGPQGRKPAATNPSTSMETLSP